LEIREMELMEQVESLESSMKKFIRGEHKHKEMLFHHARDYGKRGLGSFPEIKHMHHSIFRDQAKLCQEYRLLLSILPSHRSSY
jgi:hypothetical protein